jgi:hypothetical protein
MRPWWTGRSAAVTVALPSGRIARHAEHRAAATAQRLGNLPLVGGTDADPRLAMRNVVALTFFACMAACRSSSTPDDYDKAVYQAQIRTTLDAAFACERGYVRAHVQSPATITEISDATIAACDQAISAAVQAYMSDVVVRREDSLTASQVEHERARARADVIQKLRGDAMQLLVEGRTPGRKPP